MPQLYALFQSDVDVVGSVMYLGVAEMVPFYTACQFN